jgi:hypothetical protein
MKLGQVSNKKLTQEHLILFTTMSIQQLIGVQMLKELPCYEKNIFQLLKPPIIL